MVRLMILLLGRASATCMAIVCSSNAYTQALDPPQRAMSRSKFQQLHGWRYSMLMTIFFRAESALCYHRRMTATLLRTVWCIFRKTTNRQYQRLLLKG